MWKRRLVPLVIALAIASGAAAGLEIDLLTQPAEISIWGGVSSDRIDSVATGDLDGNGAPDLIIGEPLFDSGLGVQGRVCVYWGPFVLPASHDLATEPPPLCITGGSAALIIGFNLSAADLDGDGLTDLVTGASSAGPLNDRGNAGGIAVFRGRRTWPAGLTDADADWIFYGGLGHQQMMAATVGDLNGDGVSDLVVFAQAGPVIGTPPEHLGEALIFFGPASAWPRIFDRVTDTPPVVIQAVAERPRFGNAAATGDVVGDSIPDLIVASTLPGGTEAAISVFRGRPSWPATLTASDADLTVFESVSESHLRAVATGDRDGDGRDDLVMGAHLYSGGLPNIGAVFVIHGRSTFPVAAWDLDTRPADETIVGPRARGAIGSSVAVGDVNGDGALDIAIGAGNDATPAARTQAGAVHVLSGCPAPAALRDLASQPAELAIYGAYAGGALGLDVEKLTSADLDRDARADLFVAAPLSRSLLDARDQGSSEAHVIQGRSWATAPGDLGNTLLAVRRGLDVELQWGADPLALSYTLFEGQQKGSWPAVPLRSGISVPAVQLPGVVGSPGLSLYRASGANCGGLGP